LIVFVLFYPSINLGYIIMFSWAWPPAAVLALLNNIIEMRSDAYKHLCLCRRPMPGYGKSSCRGIGPWMFIMRFVTILSIVTATACWTFYLFYIADREDPHLQGIIGDYLSFSDMTKILIIVCVEHIVLGLHFLLQAFIPDTPLEVKYKMARSMHQEKEMLHHMEVKMLSEKRKAKHE
jgi:hypothetical protein